MLISIRFYLIFFFIINYSHKLYSSENQSAIVKKLKGNVFKITKNTTSRIRLKINDSIRFEDQINTGIKSYVQLKLINNQSIINLGPKSVFIFDKNKKTSNTVFKFLKGQLRAVIKQQHNNKISIKTKDVSIGVRGTEFVTNSYMIKNNPVTETALIKGDLEIQSKQLGIKEKSFNLKEGHYFNTQSIRKTGNLNSIKKIDPSTLNFLKNNPDGLLPKGLLNKIPKTNLTSKTISKPLYLSKNPAISTASTGIRLAHNNNIIQKKERKQNIPHDIWHAMQNRKFMAKKNVCYYWIYRSVPSAIQKVRLRREEDCDEED